MRSRPVARRHFGARPRGGSRSARLTEWVAPADQGFINVADGGATLLSSILIEAPVTVMRTRGMMSIKPQSFSADLDIVGAFGIAVVTVEAFTAGVASVPEPFTDADWGGWMVWRSFNLHLEQVTNAGLLLGSWNFEIDSKAMRKVTGNEIIVAVAESQAGAYAIADSTRTLIKLA